MKSGRILKSLIDLIGAVGTQHPTDAKYYIVNLFNNMPHKFRHII